MHVSLLTGSRAALSAEDGDDDDGMFGMTHGGFPGAMSDNIPTGDVDYTELLKNMGMGEPKGKEEL